MQLDQLNSFAFVLGQLLGLQKNPEVYSLIVKQLGSEEEAENLARMLFKIGDGFYPNRSQKNDR